MSLQDTINTEIKNAMKAKDQDALRALRGLKAEFLKAQTAEGREPGPLSDQEAQKVVQKAVKQRKDSVEQYRSNGRDELAAAEEAEIQILEGYLPKQLTEAEVKAELEKLYEELKAEGEVNIGSFMKASMARLSGRAEGKTINQLAKQILG